jgi:hypothetical protein
LLTSNQPTSWLRTARREFFFHFLFWLAAASITGHTEKKKPTISPQPTNVKLSAVSEITSMSMGEIDVVSPAASKNCWKKTSGMIMAPPTKNCKLAAKIM